MKIRASSIIFGLVCAGVLALAAFKLPGSGQSVSMGFGEPGPKSELRVSRPLIAWEVWGKNGAKVTSASMTLNGQPVNANYDASKHLLEFKPDQPLAAGDYKVSAHVAIEQILTKDVDWSFSVRADATPEAPAIEKNQTEDLAELNRIRAEGGLPAYLTDPALCAAAKAHCRYMSANNLVSHSEKPDKSSFLGKDAGTRAGAYGYSGSIYEAVGFDSVGPASATIRGLFDAPYHRIGLLQPDGVVCGIGDLGNFVTIESAFSLGDSVVTSPADHQTLARGSWEASEEPNPLEAHGLKGGMRVFVGYPIVVASFRQDVHVTGGTASLQGPGGAIPCLVNTPKNDKHLKDGLILIPKDILPPGEYHATAELEFDSGPTKKLEWSFSVKS